MSVFMFGFFLSSVLPTFTTPIYIPGSIYSPHIFSFFKKTFSLSAQGAQILYRVLPLSLPKSSEKAPSPPPLPDTSKIRAIKNNADSNKPLLTNNSGYEIDVEKLLETPLSLGEEKPAVLIVHTHTSEAYTPTEKYNYVQSDIYRSEDAAPYSGGPDVSGGQSHEVAAQI